jgi:hypothetical protein
VCGQNAGKPGKGRRWLPHIFCRDRNLSWPWRRVLVMRILSVRVTFLLVAAVASATGQSDDNWLTEKPVSVFSIASNNVCGKLARAESGQPAENLRLELKPLSYEFGRPRASMVRIRIGKTVRKSISAKDGQFSLGGARVGMYVVKVDSSSTGARATLKVLAPSGHKTCPLRLILDKGQNTVALSQE